MIYYNEEREDGFAVIGKGKQRSANIELTENQADKRAHELANRDGHGVVVWKGLDGKFERCPCSECKSNS
jgi:hypothetical protein